MSEASGGRPVALFGFAEALPAPEVAFSLLQDGFDLRVFHRRGRRPLPARRLPVGDPIEIAAPEIDAAAAIADVRAAVDATRPNVLLALDDAALWLVDAAFADGAPNGTAIANPLGAPVDVALDKTKQIAAAARAGFVAPETIVAHSDDEVRAATIDAPVIVKPGLAVQRRDGALRKGDGRYCADDVSLRACPDGQALSYPALIQPIIRGRGEGVFGFATENDVVAWSGHRRLRMMNPHGSGSSACEAIPVAAETRAAAKRMMRDIGWRGPFMIELLRGADGVAYFMELNGRLWGSLALARRAGLEYPAWAARLALNSSFQPPETALPAAGSVRHLGRDILRIAHVARGPKTALHRETWPSVWSAVAAALAVGPGERFYNFDKAYPWYFLEDAWETIGAQVRRRR